jgi:hypothetical protein
MVATVRAEEKGPATDDKPLEILPWGRTLEQQEALDRKKQQGRSGVFGCLLYLVAFALFAAYCAGWVNGKLSVNDSAVDRPLEGMHHDL